MSVWGIALRTLPHQTPKIHCPRIRRELQGRHGDELENETKFVFLKCQCNGDNYVTKYITTHCYTKPYTCYTSQHIATLNRIPATLTTLLHFTLHCYTKPYTCYTYYIATQHKPTIALHSTNVHVSVLVQTFQSQLHDDVTSVHDDESSPYNIPSTLDGRDQIHDGRFDR